MNEDGGETEEGVREDGEVVDGGRAGRRGVGSGDRARTGVARIVYYGKQNLSYVVHNNIGKRWENQTHLPPKILLTIAKI